MGKKKSSFTILLVVAVIAALIYFFGGGTPITSNANQSYPVKECFAPLNEQGCRPMPEYACQLTGGGTYTSVNKVAGCMCPSGNFDPACIGYSCCDKQLPRQNTCPQKC